MFFFFPGFYWLCRCAGSPHFSPGQSLLINFNRSRKSTGTHGCPQWLCMAFGNNMILAHAPALLDAFIAQQVPMTGLTTHKFARSRYLESL